MPLIEGYNDLQGGWNFQAVNELLANAAGQCGEDGDLFNIVTHYQSELAEKYQQSAEKLMPRKYPSTNEIC